MNDGMFGSKKGLSELISEGGKDANQSTSLYPFVVYYDCISCDLILRATYMQAEV